MYCSGLTKDKKKCKNKIAKGKYCFLHKRGKKMVGGSDKEYTQELKNLITDNNQSMPSMNEMWNRRNKIIRVVENDLKRKETDYKNWNKKFTKSFPFAKPSEEDINREYRFQKQIKELKKDLKFLKKYNAKQLLMMFW